MRLSSTMEVCLKCHNCEKQLKETEAYFYKYLCTECVAIEINKRLKTINNVSLNPINMINIYN